MKYDYAAIGTRIRNLRKMRGYSQQSLIDEILKHLHADDNERQKYTRQRLGYIENGKCGDLLTLELLTAICEILECDAAYILGEIPEKTYEVKEICAATGLSEKAVEKLINCVKDTDDYMSEMEIFKHEDGYDAEISRCTTLTYLPFFLSHIVCDENFVDNVFFDKIYVIGECFSEIYGKTDILPSTLSRRDFTSQIINVLKGRNRHSKYNKLCNLYDTYIRLLQECLEEFKKTLEKYFDDTKDICLKVHPIDNQYVAADNNDNSELPFN